MKKLTLTFVVTVVLASPTFSQNKPAINVEGTITQLSKQWFDAFLVGDGATMDKLEFPDLTLVQPDGSFFQKTQPRVQTNKPRKADRTWTAEDVKVRVAGDTAILTFLQVGKLNNGASFRVRTTEVWRREGLSWRVWAAHWTNDVTK